MSSRSAHARFSPSAAAQWLACPLSITLGERCRELPGSPIADEGTAVHELGAWAIENHLIVIDEWAAGAAGVKYAFTPEHLAHVEEYRAYVLSHQPSELHVEQRVTLTDECYGTADVIMLTGHDAFLGTPTDLHVVDLKYGFREVPADSPQLVIYLLAAVDWMESKGVFPRRCHAHIFQPRLMGGDRVKVAHFDVDELRAEWMPKLRGAFESVYNCPDAHKLGDHCHYCDARHLCPHMREQIEKVEATAEDKLLSIAPAELAELLARLPQIKSTCKAIEDHAKDLLSTGDEVPGWKLVNSRGRREWVDAAKVEQVLRNNRKVKKADFMDEKLRSPAQLEKLDGLGKEWVAKYATMRSNGTTIAPSHDKREAIQPAKAEDFEV